MAIKKSVYVSCKRPSVWDSHRFHVKNFIPATKKFREEKVLRPSIICFGDTATSNESSSLPFSLKDAGDI